MTKTIQSRLLGQEVSLPVSEYWLSFWIVMLRLSAGWWLLHAGLDKIWNWPFNAGWFVSGAAAGTALGPIVTQFSSGIMLDFVNVMIPLGQTLIGLGLVFGALTKLAAFFGAFLMVFFYIINGQTGGWSHGLVTGELLGLLIFSMIATIGAGRILGLDGYLLQTDFAKEHPKLRYIMG